MTKDWVHGVGQSSVCHILLQIVVRAVITPSPPAWTSSAGMLSFPADFPFFNDCSAASTSLRRMGWSSSVSVWRQFSSEKIIAEEQAGFRAGRSTTEQIFNLRILCEKYLQHQQDLYHVFIDFKKAFDRDKYKCTGELPFKDLPNIQEKWRQKRELCLLRPFTSPHLSLICEGHWGTTVIKTTSFLKNQEMWSEKEGRSLVDGSVHQSFTRKCKDKDFLKKVI